ncbi:UTP--glucose-1-phosphate uridylyltransferase GalU [Helcococcus ovis]|uniref:UTP--glucose-1-phosphate uridylyltransferase GalU n=1 Tax=Helcococcus TaxID=31983 RepID=UPI0038BB0E21
MKTNNLNVKKAVVPVAGFGTRFLPFTKAVPKEMLPIVDIPTIQLIVEELVESGIEEILFITNRNKHEIEDHFDYTIELEHSLQKNGKEKEYEAIRKIADQANFYYKRQKETKGLGHAILQAKEFVGNDAFAVVLGDDIVYNPKQPAIGQLIEKFNKVEKSVVGCKKVPIREIDKYGAIEAYKLDDRTYKIKWCVEKPKPEEAPSDVAILGRYVFTKDIFKYIEETKPGKGGEIQITDAIDLLAKNEGVLGYIYNGKRYDIGSKIGFLEATVEYALRDNELKDEFREYLKGICKEL